MKQPTSRRHFLKVSGAGFAAALGASASPLAGFPATPEDSPTGIMGVRVTDATRKFAQAQSLSWRATEGPAPPGDVISLSPAQKSQEYLGMGGALTDAACTMFNQLSVAAPNCFTKCLILPKWD